MCVVCVCQLRLVVEAAVNVGRYFGMCTRDMHVGSCKWSTYSAVGEKKKSNNIQREYKVGRVPENRY